jgi:hypothetical protein
MTFAHGLASPSARRHLVGHTPDLRHVGAGWLEHSGMRPGVEEALARLGVYRMGQKRSWRLRHTAGHGKRG